MLIEFLEALFIFLTVLMVVYLVRHYLFTLTVLKNSQKGKKEGIVKNEVYTPAVSILIPARNEEQVIERLLHRMTELAYSKDKLQVIVVDDASEDATGKIAEQYSRNCGYITVLRRNCAKRPFGLQGS
ncbi:MAG: glycosyltransferase [Candidatus Bathyarchaeia archaeon]